MFQSWVLVKNMQKWLRLHFCYCTVPRRTYSSSSARLVDQAYLAKMTSPFELFYKSGLLVLVGYFDDSLSVDKEE